VTQKLNSDNFYDALFEITETLSLNQHRIVFQTKKADGRFKES
jgi:hypothetical protein